MGFLFLRTDLLLQTQEVPVPRPVLTWEAQRRIICGDEKGFRISMTCDEILAALEAGKGIPVGQDPNDEKVWYLLLHSPRDNMDYIVIQNVEEGGVITLYSTADARKIVAISPEAHKEAHRLSHQSVKMKPVRTAGKCFRFRAEILDASGLSIVPRIDLKKIPSGPFEHRIENLKSNPHAVAALWKQVNDLILGSKRIQAACAQGKLMRLFIRTATNNPWELLAESK